MKTLVVALLLVSSVCVSQDSTVLCEKAEYDANNHVTWKMVPCTHPPQKWTEMQAATKKRHFQFVRKHPVLVMLIGGGVGGALAGWKWHDKGCPSTYDGKPYQGTPWGPYPCPQYAPGKK